MMVRMHRAVLVLVPLLIAGCPPAQQNGKPEAGTTACTALGQSCEFAPGKLGTCVQNDNCGSGSACFVCQSQH